VAERRVCSVLFCDVVGFTPLSESRDPEAVRELLSEYFAVARTVVSRYGGVVEKFIGDAVMAVWGAPAATEGDAERAVRAALDLVAAVAEVDGGPDAPVLSARAGVVTGEVAVTLGATGEGMVAGDAVNTAARVQAAAEPGQVLVDGATYRLAGSAVGFADTGEHQLKGKADPVRLLRATRVLAGAGGSQRVDGLEAPLTGRDAELRTVRELFHAAAERQVPRLVLVSGPAGTGKSRLGWEFRKYIEGLAAEVWWHRGRCLSYGEGVAFWALAEMVRQRLGIAEEDSADVAAGKLAAGLDRFVPDPGERAYVGVRLGRLLGVGSADGAAALSREELFAGWRLFFERLAAESPVVLLVEDAQYADSGLLDFLDHLVDWAKNLPIYVLVFARPELEQVRPRFGVGRNRVTLTLDPLDPESMDHLVDALVPGMPKAARSKVTRQAQGVPLFAVETVRSLVDRDIVQPVEGVYRLVGDIGELTVPDSLHALLAARLDVLDPGVRRLVADAAVLGITFPAEALVPISGRDDASVRAALADLVRREVLSVSAAEQTLASLQDLRASEAPQDHTTLGLAEAFTAVAQGRPAEALRRARAVLTYADAVGIGHGELVWLWSLAVRAAYEVGDAVATQELLALLDSYQPGHVVPLLRAERDLARARQADQDGDQGAAVAFAAAITALREHGTPYHLAHGVLDHAQYLTRHRHPDAAAQAIEEARAIGARLRCQPLLDRADAIEHAQHQIRA
jgi:class 3 adenylate cyclase